MENDLTVPLTMAQIDAANRFHEQVSGWQVTGDVLRALHVRFPGFANDPHLAQMSGNMLRSVS